MNKKKKVFVSGCFDLLHSGHIEFLRQASNYGNLYVGIGSDKTILELKKQMPCYTEEERLYIVSSIKFVKKAFINSGDGYLDFKNEFAKIKPDYFVVNHDGGSKEKKALCKKYNVKYIELDRIPKSGIKPRSSRQLKPLISNIPARIDLAGAWLDQAKLSSIYPGWVITLSLNPTFSIQKRSGMATSTRETIKQIWPYELPKMNPEKLAKIVFCCENKPSNNKNYISGAQDAIGICLPGLVRHYYNGSYWPVKIESIKDKRILKWLENHICLVKLKKRDPNYEISFAKCSNKSEIIKLAKASNNCWKAIKERNLKNFCKELQKSFNAQTNLFPAAINKEVGNAINKYSKMENVLAWKVTGAGGGGYLILVCDKTFPEDAINISIRDK